MIFKPVAKHEYCCASRYTGYIAKTIMLTLECGHEQFRKASQGVPAKARCRECERDPNAVIEHYNRQTIARTERATR